MKKRTRRQTVVVAEALIADKSSAMDECGSSHGFKIRHAPRLTPIFRKSTFSFGQKSKGAKLRRA